MNIKPQAQVAFDRTVRFINKEYGIGVLKSGDRNDIVSIAKKLEFKIVLMDMNEADGFVVVNDGEAIPEFNCNKVIAVNSQKSWKSKRYIIAMELSYYLNLKSENPSKPLKYSKEISVDDEHVGEEAVNSEVALLAARLLMPDDGLETKLAEFKGKQTDPKKTVKELSDYFEVPYTLAAKRMDLWESPSQEGRV
jgi:Zn-dependent peptidase ImmA (M78 family)